MGSERVVASRDDLMAVIGRSLLVVLFAMMWIAASGSAHAAKKDASMCAALKGAAKGLCTAAAALGCGDATKHQQQCDALGDKFEALTGDVPPWEDVPPPPPTGDSVTLAFDVDAFDLETGSTCAQALGAACNEGDAEFIRQPNDFWMAFDFEQPTSAILVPVLVCTDGTDTVSILVLENTPFGSVDASVIGSPGFTENLLEVPMKAGDTIVIRTCDENYFKIGNVWIEGNSVTVSYEELGF